MYVSWGAYGCVYPEEVTDVFSLCTVLWATSKMMPRFRQKKFPVYSVYSVYHATNRLFTRKFLDFVTTSPSSEALYRIGFCRHWYNVSMYPTHHWVPVYGIAMQFQGRLRVCFLSRRWAGCLLLEKYIYVVYYKSVKYLFTRKHPLPLHFDCI
jgi:hypothetical protein